MPLLAIDVVVFDPVAPTKLVAVHHPGMDTWFDHALLRSDFRRRLSSVSSTGREAVPLSGGMGIVAEVVEIGAIVGTVRVARLKAYVVDEGRFGIQFGSDLLKEVFAIGGTESDSVRVTSAAKDDPESLALEVYSIDPPMDVANLEAFFLGLRMLHNIALLATSALPLPPATEVSGLIAREEAIPNSLRLKVTWLDTGSIWMTVKSGCRAALKYSAKFFEIGATAKAAHLAAAAKDAENAASIHDATRAATIGRVAAEENRLKVENIARTQQAWREDVLRELDFRDELISRVNDRDVQMALQKERDKAVRLLLEQHAFPIVRNLPRDYEPPEAALLLPERFDQEE